MRPPQAPVPEELRSAAAEYHRPGARGVQFHAAAAPGSVVGQPHRHMAADLQVGEGLGVGGGGWAGGNGEGRWSLLQEGLAAGPR
jgi:hypothetical protein